MPFEDGRTFQLPDTSGFCFNPAFTLSNFSEKVPQLTLQNINRSKNQF